MARVGNSIWTTDMGCTMVKNKKGDKHKKHRYAFLSCKYAINVNKNGHNMPKTLADERISKEEKQKDAIQQS